MKGATIRDAPHDEILPYSFAIQVGRTSSITLSQAAPAPRATSTLPTGAQNADGGDVQCSNDAENNFSAALEARESIADKMRDAASTAAASLAQTASVVAGGGGSSMEGRWEQDTFLLPLPDVGENALAIYSEGKEASGVDHEEDGVDVPALLGAVEQGSGKSERDNADGDTSTEDEGAQLRVEIWQGKHCHGQVGVFSRDAASVVKHHEQNTGEIGAHIPVDNQLQFDDFSSDSNTNFPDETHLLYFSLYDASQFFMVVSQP